VSESPATCILLRKCPCRIAVGNTSSGRKQYSSRLALHLPRNLALHLPRNGPAPTYQPVLANPGGTTAGEIGPHQSPVCRLCSEWLESHAGHALTSPPCPETLQGPHATSGTNSPARSGTPRCHAEDVCNAVAEGSCKRFGIVMERHDIIYMPRLAHRMRARREPFGSWRLRSAGQAAPAFAIVLHKEAGAWYETV
jgi:hypothetical protein